MVDKDTYVSLGVDMVFVEGRSYQTRVRVRNAVGWGAWSAPSLPCVVHHAASVHVIWEGDLEYHLLC